MRKTKIICTLGPSTDSEEKLRDLILAGMNVARFNFSHGSHEEHLKKLKTLIKVRKELGMPVATLLDTKGPEVRVCKFKDGKINLVAGNTFILTTDDIEGDETKVSVTYKNLSRDVKVGNTILIDDGLIELTVESIKGNDVICKIVNGGAVSNNKGVNIPDVNLNMPYLSEKDIEDIKFGVENDFDFIAASFTRCAEDVLQIRKLLETLNCQNIKIIPKIENNSGVQNVQEIIRVSDGIMIARGDMGVEIPFSKLPAIQKKLIKKCVPCGKIVITATQMLESMINNPRPTRAEATDVANAIYDGTSAIMLSGETAAGKYPIEAVKTMDSIAKITESDIDYKHRFYNREKKYERIDIDVTNAISHATCTTAYDLNAKAILTVTRSGQTAKMISRYRPDIPIIGCTTDIKVYRQLSLSWGVTPMLVGMQPTADLLFDHAVDKAKELNHVENGDIVVITAGVPIGIPGTTNLIKVQPVGDTLATGTGINEFSSTSRAYVLTSLEKAKRDFVQGDIIVVKETSNEMMSLLKKASGIITEYGGLNSHAAIVGLTRDIPVIVGAKNATSIIKTGITVSMDAQKGIVCTCNTAK